LPDLFDVRTGEHARSFAFGIRYFLLVGQNLLGQNRVSTTLCAVHTQETLHVDSFAFAYK
jgi:hypothetical protein